jgi:hypothetical protein
VVAVQREHQRSVVVVVLGAAGAGLTVLHLVTRASCPPGYSHLLDVSWPVLGLSVAVAVVGLISIGRRDRLPVPLEAILLFAGVLAVLAAAMHLLFLRDTCWTF